MLGALSCGRCYKFGVVDVLKVSSMLFFVLIVSGCKESGSEFHIPAKEKQCIDYTKAAIQARGENYAKYTDKVMDSGEAVWVAGKKFDFDFVRPAAGVSVAAFRNGYHRVDKQGRRYPGVSVTMKQDVDGVKKRNPGLIKTAPDPKTPHIIIRLECEMGAVPHPKNNLSVDDAYSEIMDGRVSSASIKMNKDIGYYEVHKEKYPFVLYLKESDGRVDLNYPPVFCSEDGGSLICFGKTTFRENINLHYGFPGAQLSDFARIHQETLKVINLAFAKGRN